MKNKIIEVGSLRICIYDTPDNKTVDIVQDTDMLVLSHNEAIKLANELLSALK